MVNTSIFIASRCLSRKARILCNFLASLRGRAHDLEQAFDYGSVQTEISDLAKRF